MASTDNIVPTYDSSKLIHWDYQNADFTLTEPVEIHADDERIFSLNLASVSPEQIIWKCGGSTTTSVSNSISATIVPFESINGEILTCNNLYAVYTATDAKNN